MMQVIRIIVVTGVAGWLCWFLGKTVVDGIKSGAIHHTDSTKVCRRKTNPAGFWALVVLFSGFVGVIAWGWAFVMVDAIRDIK